MKTFLTPDWEVRTVNSKYWVRTSGEISASAVGSPNWCKTKSRRALPLKMNRLASAHSLSVPTLLHTANGVWLLSSCEPTGRAKNSPCTRRRATALAKIYGATFPDPPGATEVQQRKGKETRRGGPQKIVQKSSCFYQPERYIRGGFVPSFMLREFSSL